MNTLELKARLQQPYERENWIEVAKDVFHNLSILEKPLAISGKPDFVKSFQQLGFVNLQDGRNLAMIEIIVDDTKNLARNKVQLRNLTNKLIDEHSTNGVLVIYDNDLDSNYRFTFASRESVINEQTGEFERKETNAKRFTYLLGPGESCTTAATQLIEISNKGGSAGMEDVIKAFNVEKVNKEFFNGYKKQYEAFTAHLSTASIKASVFNGEEKDIRDFAKKMLGRIVFIYFLQKKGWMGVPEAEKGWTNGDKDFLRNLFIESGSGEDYYAVWLSNVFFDSLNNKRVNDLFIMPDGTKVKVPYLNGGLFEAETRNTSLLTFLPSLFKNLFEFFSQYNFTIYEDDPEERFLAVDPEMLGHIFENLLEDNKDKGAFYTPKEIVHYMCRESLIEYLYTKLSPKTTETYKEIGKTQTDLFGNKARKQLAIEELIGTPKELIKRESIEKLVLHHEAAEIINYEKEILKALYEVKICDPAIGSGAFPMGLLTEIFQLVETLHNVTPDVTAEIWKLGNDWNPATVKKQIIQNSIYGVDIEKGAVDIARLRFWLSLIIDEEEPKPLPNLDYKIVVGNSLLSKFEDEVIDIDWDIKFKNASAVSGIITNQQVNFHLLHSKQKLFFVAIGDKTNLRIQIRDLKINVLINQLTLSRIQFTESNKIQKSAFPTQKEIQRAEEITEKTRDYNRIIHKLEAIKLHKNRPFEFFDWKLDFAEVMNKEVTKDVGFDILIGNPPYIQMQKDGGLLANELAYRGFKTYERTGDIYAIFYEKGFDLLKKHGVHTLITSSQWIRAKYGKSLRKYFIFQNPKTLILLGPGIFENATVDTNIMIAKKEEYYCELEGLVVERRGDIELINQSQLIPMKKIGEEPWILLDDIKQKLNDKIINSGKPLGNWNLKICRGILTGLNEAFIIDENKREKLIKADKRSEEIIKPILRGREIDKYFTEWDGRFIIATFPSLNLSVDNYPGIKDYLEKFKPRINQTGEVFIDDTGKQKKTRKKTINKWFETQDPIGYYKEFQNEKIIWKRIGSDLRFTYYENEIYSLDSTCIATGEKIKYLTALLNSKLCKYQLFKSAPRTGMGDLLISVQALEPLSVYYPTIEEEKEIVLILDEILKIKEEQKSIDTTLFEKKIDLYVYKLYQLTYEEACIIEGCETWMNKEDYEKFVLE